VAAYRLQPHNFQHGVNFNDIAAGAGFAMGAVKNTDAGNARLSRFDRRLEGSATMVTPLAP
jgi:hypothetical protein